MPTHGTFLWCDLSALNLDQASRFYGDLLGWQVASGDYRIASTQSGPVAGLFSMPEMFRKISMPSFWMSYMAVRDIEAAVATAREHGGKVEIGPEPFPGGGQFALIRDPLGAGFTVFEGGSPAGATDGAGGRLDHGLFVSDADAVIPFYEALFGWAFGPAKAGVRTIAAGGETVAHLHEIPDPALRGKEEYWAVIFQAAAGTAKRLSSLGGTALAQTRLPEGAATMARDPDGAMFFFVEGAPAPTRTGPPMLWAWVGLGLIAMAIATGWGWIGALFFAVWVVQGLRSGMTYLFQPIERTTAPLAYWLTLGSFGLLGVFSVLGYG